MLDVLVTALAIALGWIYQVDPAICNGCGNCIPWCPEGAISIQGPDAVINPELCTGCGICVMYCPRGAIYKFWYSSAPDESTSVAFLEPNPTPGPFSITAPPGSTIRIFDACGRLACSSQGTGAPVEFDLSGERPGAYPVLVGDEPGGCLVLLGI